ncbi:MAG: NUDIX hydrolase [endosymbiont of Galathealinum brachiosum]|uniref:Phosphatase NudJ n=1 Tax=endosymbiont of Galathealinum brachiosum TaxID=2200906 RepID=A0A370DGL9_9GAMM|nr:MAG: NUDIX hydrolase [endosymbiont of Galathealinum brachiosum]
MTDIWKPHATVAAIIERDNQFLMVEEIAGGQTVYNQPAGHLDPNESLVEAAVRETREETAWHFIPEYISGIYRWDQSSTNRCFLRVAFVGSCDDYKKEQPLDDGIIRALWLTREELAAQTEKLRSPMVLRCIDDYLSGIKYPLDLLTDIQ